MTELFFRLKGGFLIFIGKKCCFRYQKWNIMYVKWIEVDSSVDNLGYLGITPKRPDYP